MLEAALTSGASVDHPGEQGNRALFYACRDGRQEMIRRLLAAGASANLSNDLGATPLMMASAGGWADCVRVLLDAGADAKTKAVRATSSKNATACHSCAAPANARLTLPCPPARCSVGRRG